MLTPRRTVLLLAGFVLFGTAYVAYAHLLGWLDGLPQLPDKYLQEGNSTVQPPPRNDSPTTLKLAEAFGPKAPETDYALYETQLEFRNGESSVVVAAGPAPSNPNSNRVALSPFSLALFGKPKPAHLRQPGEATEITTVHSDKAILEFDRVITNPADMRVAKLVRLELLSDFEQTFDDPRRGTVHIVSNQKFADPNRFLVIRTPGPVFYREPKTVAGTPAAQGPDLWTDAPVEIVDRQNLPRAVGAPAPGTANIKSEEARTSATVADVLSGRRPPPPTVTAVGLRVYLEPAPPPGAPKPKKTGGMHGLRKLDLLEQVVVNLWVDNGQSMVGGPSPDGQKSGLAMVPPPRELAAIGGNLSTAGYAARLQNRALLQIDTRGPFSYDAARDVARFDVVPHSDPNLPNDVLVSKVPAKGGTSSLFSQVLELEMNSGATSAARPANSPAVKKLHAWTYTAGRFLTVASQDELMEAYGQDLVHEQAASRTTLTGAPLYVVRERNVLSAGAPQRAATLVSEPGPTPGGKSQITVRGAGRVDLYDSASKANTLTAVWQTSLVQTREVVNGRDQDLFTFTGGSKFEDVKADYWLKGDILKLWLEPRGAPTVPPKTATAALPTPTGPPKPTQTADPGGQAKPSRIHAIGNVTSHSTEYDVEQTTQLNVFFADASPTPVVIAPPVAPQPMVGPVAVPPKSVGTPAAPAPVVAVAPKVEPKGPPPKPKPPTKIRARTVDTWVTRISAPPAAAPVGAPAKPQGVEEKGPKYQLDRARCEDDVVVHQDPTDPTKPRGVDILGRLLLIDGAPEGSKLTVYGWPNRPGEVHQEEMSLLGPEVVLDQIHNAASVVGRGALTMPTSSDLSGTELKQPEVVVIHWRDRMNFRGAQRSAEFEGKVSARQGESWVLCHTMQVTFDRPVYFNQTQKRTAPQAAGEKAKLDIVRCYPAAADSADSKDELFVYYNQVEFDTTGKMVKSQQLKAQVLEMFAQFQDSKGGEKYQLVKAEGPGRMRVWQQGEKELGGPSPGAKPMPKPGVPAPATPTPKAAEPDVEMKLTQVDFRGGMTATDKGKRYQEAIFDKTVEVFSVPADSPSVAIERNRLPPRSVMLTCADKLVVWSHKQANAVAKQRMDATGNAYIRSDEYDGWGETISHDDKRVTLTGSDAVPARVTERYNRGSEQAGRRIVYDRSTGSYQVFDSTGGTLGGSKK